MLLMPRPLPPPPGLKYWPRARREGDDCMGDILGVKDGFGVGAGVLLTRRRFGGLGGGMRTLSSGCSGWGDVGVGGITVGVTGTWTGVRKLALRASFSGVPESGSSKPR